MLTITWVASVGVGQGEGEVEELSVSLSNCFLFTSSLRSPAVRLSGTDQKPDISNVLN